NKWLSEGRIQEKSATPEKIGGPSIIRKAYNFGRAATRHVATGARNVSDEDYQARLSVCRDCPSCDLQKLVCRQKSCGCYLTKKARWESERCPLGKWPTLGAAAPATQEPPRPITFA